MKNTNFIYCTLVIYWLLSAISSFAQPKAIAHALGAIGGHTYSNSREAMISSIEKGYKFLEVDIDSTSDGVFIASHDWTGFNIITDHSELLDSLLSFAEFSERKIYGEYTPISIQEIVDTLKNHPDVSIVTDKISDPAIIEKLFSEIKDRVYVECFLQDDYFVLKKKGYNVMQSSYFVDNTFTNVISNLLRGNGRIDFITASTDQNYKVFRNLKCVMPLKVAMFSIDTQEFFDEHMDEIEFFYSNYYDPSTGTFNKPKK